MRTPEQTLGTLNARVANGDVFARAALAAARDLAKHTNRGNWPENQVARKNYRDGSDREDCDADTLADYIASTRHSGLVVTWQSPRGDTIEICAACDTQLSADGRWPKDGSGGEYCRVHQGAHVGACEVE